MHVTVSGKSNQTTVTALLMMMMSFIDIETNSWNIDYLRSHSYVSKGDIFHHP